MKKIIKKGRKNGRKEKRNVFTENLNESDCDVSLECSEEKHFIVDRLCGVSCVSIQCRFCPQPPLNIFLPPNNNY